jgi:hypothetical protein
MKQNKMLKYFSLLSPFTYFADPVFYDELITANNTVVGTFF